MRYSSDRLMLRIGRKDREGGMQRRYDQWRELQTMYDFVFTDESIPHPIPDATLHDVHLEKRRIGQSTLRLQ